jgi:hypothetical protein
MTKDQIRALIADKCGYKITVSKNTGSMKHWTTFTIFAPFKDRENVRRSLGSLGRRLKRCSLLFMTKPAALLVNTNLIF